MAKAKRAKDVKGRPRAFKAARVPTPIPSADPTSSIATPAVSICPPTNAIGAAESCDLENGPVTMKIRTLSLGDALPEQAKTVDSKLADIPFRFLDLPSELRLKVYSYHFEGNNRPIDISPENVKLIHNKMPILRTCRQVYGEASHYFYSSRTFRLFPTDSRRFNRLKKPLIARLKPHQRASLTSLELRVGPGWSKPPKSWVVNKRLNLAECVSVRQLCVLVECDPSNSVFNGFRRAEGFYEAFCKKLLDDVLNGLPAIERVQFDAWESVKKTGDMMQGLLETAAKNRKKIVWGPERGWTDADEEDDSPPKIQPATMGSSLQAQSHEVLPSAEDLGSFLLFHVKSALTLTSNLN